MGDMGGIFGLLGVGCGIYVFYAWYKMKTTGELTASILLPKDINPAKCKDKKGYIKAVSPKMLALAIVAVLYGAVDLCNTYVTAISVPVFWVILIMFFVVIIWFSVTVSKLNKTYFQ